MYQFEITSNEAGQRFDKYLHKLLPEAPSSFFYKMLRKKNIVLNGKRAEGKDKLHKGDKVSLFLSEETFQAFQGRQFQQNRENEYLNAYRQLTGIRLVYENPHMILVNKPAGILTQKARETDLSVNEWLIGYLLQKKEITKEALNTYRPSVCNRLDRNTSGLVICAKSLYGSQRLSYLIRERKVRKFYRLFVKGRIEKEACIEGYLSKNELTNLVNIFSSPVPGASYIETRYYPIKKISDLTYLEAELVTGKPHQIRAHLAAVGHPLLLDYKYGDQALNHKYQDRLKADGQLLHAYRLVFPEEEPVLMGEKHIFIAKEPSVFLQLLDMGKTGDERI